MSCRLFVPAVFLYAMTSEINSNLDFNSTRRCCVWTIWREFKKTSASDDLRSHQSIAVVNNDHFIPKRATRKHENRERSHAVNYRRTLYTAQLMTIFVGSSSTKFALNGERNAKNHESWERSTMIAAGCGAIHLVDKSFQLSFSISKQPSSSHQVKTNAVQKSSARSKAM